MDGQVAFPDKRSRGGKVPEALITLSSKSLAPRGNVALWEEQVWHCSIDEAQSTPIEEFFHGRS